MASLPVVAALCLSAPARAEPGFCMSRAAKVDGFSLPNVAGDTVALAAKPERATIVHFFATWCVSCRPELESLNTLAAQDPDRLRVLSISVAEPAMRLKRYFDGFAPRFEILLDESRAVARAWSVHALPATFVLDRELRPVLQVRGELDWGSAPVRDELERVAAGAPLRSPTCQNNEGGGT
ncbi:TlpA family protein disulfide reductase [Enterovirga aerilata]|uniref:TlpA family protein disulfide reductase n=1 Tax=Enterovirga aerilata TaxID=2730920 RepID=A0A849I8X3_9HYPH|nr:TlpA disulfide reductase family protein [Enterovirga sp. DB1703]NNM72447.1 TlpA family protein disulfide reductase [Enterovirga sp. DB1703]